jgi:putative ABC transport system permease protein
MTPLGLAWANLAHKRTRTLIATAGVAFAVVLAFMELGFYGGVGRTATILYDKLRFDLLLISTEYLDLSRPADVPRLRLAQAQAAEGVRDVTPLSFGIAIWRLPARTDWLGRPVPAGGVMSINILSVPPDRLEQAFVIGENGVFETSEEAREAGTKLARLDTFLLDRRSRPDFGRVEELVGVPPAGDPATGTAVRLNGRRAEVVGGFDLGTGFSWTGMLMCGEETYRRFVPQPADRVSFGLVHLEPGADPAAVQRQLREILPGDVRVLTGEEIAREERRYWTQLTSVGQLLLVAVTLAVVVGVIFVYQMMAADIRSMLPEYATVKALGYKPGYLSAVVLWQAVLLAVLGYVPGFAVSLGLFAGARAWGGIPTVMTAEVAAGVLVLTVGMCLASGLLAVRKVHAADPADLF